MWAELEDILAHPQFGGCWPRSSLHSIKMGRNLSACGLLKSFAFLLAHCWRGKPRFLHSVFIQNEFLNSFPPQDGDCRTSGDKAALLGTQV